MTKPPSLCPTCGAFVRHDWTDRCGRCDSPFVEILPTTDVSTSETASESSTSTAAAASPPAGRTAVTTSKKAPLLAIGGVGVVILAIMTMVGLQLTWDDPATSDDLATGPSETTTTTANGKSTSDLGKAFVAGLGESKPFKLGNSGNATTSQTPAQLAATDWIRATGDKCKCSADFPWDPRQTTMHSDGEDIYILEAAVPTSPVSAFLITFPYPTTSEVSDHELEAIAVGAASGINASITSITTKTELGTRVVVARGQGSTALIEKVFVKNGTAYVIGVGSIRPSDDLAPVFNRFVNSFVLNSTVGSDPDCPGAQ
jgi:hypothetical protein